MLPQWGNNKGLWMQDWWCCLNWRSFETSRDCGILWALELTFHLDMYWVAVTNVQKLLLQIEGEPYNGILLTDYCINLRSRLALKFPGLWTSSSDAIKILWELKGSPRTDTFQDFSHQICTLNMVCSDFWMCVGCFFRNCVHDNRFLPPTSGVNNGKVTTGPCMLVRVAADQQSAGGRIRRLVNFPFLQEDMSGAARDKMQAEPTLEQWSLREKNNQEDQDTFTERVITQTYATIWIPLYLCFVVEACCTKIMIDFTCMLHIPVLHDKGDTVTQFDRGVSFNCSQHSCYQLLHDQCLCIAACAKWNSKWSAVSAVVKI